MFDSSPHMAPFLLKLYESGQMGALLQNQENKKFQSEIMSAVVDLLDLELSMREQELFADVMIVLLKKAEIDLRQAIAERLAVIDNVPLRIILHLSDDEISVATPVLQKSIVLSDLDLVYIIKSNSAQYWQAIAGRRVDTGDVVIDALIETNDVDTLITLSKNEQITLAEHAIHALAGIAAECPELAQPLAERREVPDMLAQALYKQAAKTIEATLMNDGVGQREDVRAAIEDVVEEFVAHPCRRKRSGEQFVPTAEMTAAARQFSKKGVLTVPAMLRPLQRGQIASFIALFARYTGLPKEKIITVLNQPCGKGLAILCRAGGITGDDFSSIYQMTHCMRSGTSFISQSDMNRVVHYFQRLRPDVARRLVYKATEF